MMAASFVLGSLQAHVAHCAPCLAAFSPCPQHPSLWPSVVFPGLPLPPARSRMVLSARHHGSFPFPRAATWEPRGHGALQPSNSVRKLPLSWPGAKSSHKGQFMPENIIIFL